MNNSRIELEKRLKQKKMRMTTLLPHSRFQASQQRW